MTRQQEAKLIFDRLLDNKKAGVMETRYQLMKGLGLTPMQFAWGWSLLKEQMESHGHGLVVRYHPVASGLGSYFYYLPETVSDQAEYDDLRLRGIETMLKRIESVTRGACIQFKGDPGYKVLRTLRRDITHARETITDALTP